jgi:cell division protein FtsI (penicillin-binding protein 3)
VRASLLLLAFVLSLFVGRLVQVQALDAEGYATAAQNVRSRTVPLPATRGSITDSNGVVLAQSVEARLVTADPMLVADPGQYAHLLAPLLRVHENVLRQRLADRPRRWVLLARDVTPATWRAIKQLVDPGTGKPLIGIHSEPQSRRVYPADQVAANVLGFVGRDGRGQGGIERAFDAVLAGRDGKLTYERDRTGRRIATAGVEQVKPVPGRDVRLTIDREVQWVAQQAIAAKVTEAGAESGTVVVLDVKTGDILAMATAPTFNPNQPGRGRDENRGNRALSEVYEPGSIAKIMTTAAVLEEGAATPETKITVPGRLSRGGHSFGDHWGHGTLRLTLTGVLAKSSNIGTVLAAEQLDAATLHRYFERFGVGRPTGLRFPGESRGILAPAEEWSASQRYTVTFGQGLAVNAVQAASTFATIANGGVRVQPRLVAGWTDEDGHFRPAPAGQQTRVVSARTAAQVAQMMEQVTRPGGTAKIAAIPGYRVAGKTGTAQRVDPSCGCYRGYTASFAGFAPADDPRIVVSVTLQKPVNGHTGGLLGGPVFRDVMSFALQSRGVPPTGRPPARLPIDW